MNPVMWLDDIGKPAWIALMVVSFILFWPIGLVVLGYLIGSGRMSCWMHQGSRQGGERWQARMERMQQRMQERAARWGGPLWAGNQPGGPSSGNWAFDEYRAETLRRLEEEQRQFREFLDRLRHAKDKAEFDQFMAEMRGRPQDPAPQPGG
jgi:hypothetical protein